ncbi:hypothetical protein OIU84_016896 [Salix udensis]|uniref:Pectate lyase n=1 Tax=Salix udensis TaxID=889485 RepID=A0AAD6NQB3_9ROSI|nr:hypothetical protein OIU84_016896 [Salix udensis]
MLLGHSDSYTRDKQMQVTIAYNHFGEGLIQRMPRCRHGYFHVVNNDYTHWEMYAIGGSADPTINSQGNRFLAPANAFAKEVTKRVGTAGGVWRRWNWRSEGDLLLNGAYFTVSGAGAAASYARASSLGAKSSSMVGVITSKCWSPSVSSKLAAILFTASPSLCFSPDALPTKYLQMYIFTTFSILLSHQHTVFHCSTSLFPVELSPFASSPLYNSILY